MQVPPYLKKTVNKILKLRLKGRKVEQLTPYQYRINDELDLYPVNKRFHNIKTGQRGYIPYGIL